MIGSVQERESEREARAVWVVVVVRWRLLSELQQVVDREERREDGTATLPLLPVSQSVVQGCPGNPVSRQPEGKTMNGWIEENFPFIFF